MDWSAIDNIRINFSPDQLVFLNIALGFLMFGVALEIKLADFTRLFEKPRIPLIGLFSQLVLLPIATLLMIYFVELPPSMALGMVLVAACPGGNVSNYAVHLAGANTALSVLLTSVSTMMAIVITPSYFSWLSALVPGAADLRQSISVSIQDVMENIFVLLFIPVAIGMAVNHLYPKWTTRIKKPVKALSMIIFLSIVIFAIVGNIENIQNYLHLVFFLVLAHNMIALVIGYQWARLMGLEKREIRTISIETGIQNSGLALILIFNFFDGLGGMAMIAAWWGTWHLISGFALASFWAWKA